MVVLESAFCLRWNRSSRLDIKFPLMRCQLAFDTSPNAPCRMGLSGAP